MEAHSNDKTNKISRKKFLRVCGSVIAGGSILGVSGVLLKNRSAQTNVSQENIASGSQQPAFTSPYKLVSSFSVPENIECLDITEDKLIVAIANNILIYDQHGALLNNISIKSDVRDIEVRDNLIYLLYPKNIEVYDMKGEWIREWEACSENSDYCSFVTTPDFVFVTDASNKNVCKYTKEGNFERFIQSPNGFVIPSYTFGIVYLDGKIYCSNSGRHLIESYTLDGEYAGSFGRPGGATGMFCGCCNPVHLTNTSTGEIITSEKGNPRISCYSPDGEFRSMLLDAKMLGGGNTAYDVKISGDKVFVAGKNLISTFQYDSLLAKKSSCSTCNKDCVLRDGISI